MLCSGCRNFIGNPCASCRTLSRLHFLLERNQLPAACEGRVVGALRVAAGEICDVVEQQGIFRPLLPAPRVGALDAEAKGSLEGERLEEKAAKEKKEDSKKTAKESKKEKKRKSEAGVEETPDKGKEGEVRDEPTAEPIRAAKATPLIGKERKKKSEQEELDHYVATHPERFGLGSLSIRGSAAKHFKENDARKDERPPEPSRPPPSSDATGAPEDRTERRQRQRSRSKKRKKSKGERHRIRGREFWRRAKEQEKWGQRQRPRRRPDPRGRQG